MKKVLSTLFIFLTITIHAQNMFRYLPQNNSNTAGSTYNEVKEPKLTADKGYIFSFRSWIIGIENSFPSAYYTIKTDSNLVPQWKKPSFSSAVILPTGGIILISTNAIEKITASGVQSWIKTFSGEDIVVNDGVTYDNKIRIVGRKRGYVFSGLYTETSQPYTLLLDTSGSFISQSLFTTSNNSYVDFSKIKRDSQGNFFVYSNFASSFNSACLAKFDTSFTCLWAKTANYLHLQDIDLLPNGRIFASANIGYSQNAGFVKLDAQGDVQAQYYFPHRGLTTGLCKKQNGNYIATLSGYWQDTLTMVEVDTSLSLSWAKTYGRGRAVTTPLIKNSSLITSLFYNNNPVITTADLNGNHCFSVPENPTGAISTYSFSSFTLTPVSSSASVNNATLNLISQQNYSDSCKCTVIQTNPTSRNICINTTSTLSVVGTVNWYASTTASTSVGSGSSIVYSSATPTVKTFYVRDSSCYISAVNIPVTLSVNPIPSLSLNASSFTTCSNQSATLIASGATFYSWTPQIGYNYGDTLIIFPTSTTSFTVTGSGGAGAGCSDTKTLAVTVYTTIPTLTVNPLQYFCNNDASVSFSASGANSYLWSNGIATNTMSILSPTANLNFTVAGSNGTCTATKNVTAIMMPAPSLTVIASDSSICMGQSVSLIAYGATNLMWTQLGMSNPLIVTPTTNTTYSAVGSFTNGCYSIKTISINVTSLSLTVSSPQSVCDNSTVSLNASGATTYTWSNGTNASSLSVMPPLGISVYSLVAELGPCTETAVTSVTVSPSPTLSILSTPSLVCSGQSQTLIASGASSFTWNAATNSSSLVFISLSQTSVTLAGSNGACVKSSTFLIQPLPNPTLTLVGDTSGICYGKSLALSVSGASQYLWNTGSVSNAISDAPSTTTVYAVKGTDSNGCSDTKSISITIHPLPQISAATEFPIICLGELSVITASGAVSYSYNGVSDSDSHLVYLNQTTTYTIIGVDASGCEGQTVISQFVSSCTGLENINSPGRLAVYPNPGNGLFMLNNSFSSAVSFEIYNAIGQLILSQKITEPLTSFSLENQASGVYYLKIMAQNKLLYVKIVKQ